jgi:hypothetical protein
MEIVKYKRNKWKLLSIREINGNCKISVCDGRLLTPIVIQDFLKHTLQGVRVQ